MSNALYEYGKRIMICTPPSMASPSYFNWTVSTLKVALLNNSYTAAVGTDKYWNAASLATVVAPTTLAGATFTDNGGGGAPTCVFTGSNVTFTSVSSTGGTITQIVVYNDTATASNSPLIVWIGTATGLPVTPNGGNITIQWDGTNGIWNY